MTKVVSLLWISLIIVTSSGCATTQQEIIGFVKDQMNEVLGEKKKESPLSQESPKAKNVHSEEDLLATYVSRAGKEPRFFLGLRKDNLYLVGFEQMESTGIWQVEIPSKAGTREENRIYFMPFS